MPDRPLLLGAALHGRRPDPDPAAWTAAARAADEAGLDLVTVEDGPMDPLLVAARLAAQTRHVGVLAVACTTTTEPFHVSTAVATIDVVGEGRGGWVAVLGDRERDAASVTWEVPGDVVADALEHLDVVRRLWDSWEEGAEIRDTATDRFIDRDLLHHVDFRGAHLRVRGPSITPRPPSGHPVTAVRDARLAAQADLLLGGGLTPRPAPGPLRLADVDVTPADAEALAERLATAHAAGLAGAVLHTADLPAVLDALLPALERRGVPRGAPAATLRERLGLPPATNRYRSVPA